MTINEAGNSSAQRDLTVLCIGTNLFTTEEEREKAVSRYREFHFVSDGLQGVLAFARHKPDLVITESGLARMDCLTMTKSIRDIRPNIPIIFVLDYSDRDILMQISGFRYASFVFNPAETDFLLGVLSDWADTILAGKDLENLRKLSLMTLRSLPYPAMLISRHNRRIIIANDRASSLGFRNGDECVGPLFPERIFGVVEESFDDYIAYYEPLQLKGVEFAGKVWDVTLSYPAQDKVLFSASDVTELNSALKALKRAGVELEERVRDRTAELEAANTGLKQEIEYRKKVEDLLRKLEAHQRALSENSPDMIIRFDVGMRYVFVNPAFTRIIGVPQEEVLMKSELKPGPALELRDNLLYKIAEVFALGQPLEEQFEFKAPTGIKFFDWKLAPEFGEDGKVDSILTIARDITELKNVEKKLRQMATTDSLTGLYNRGFFMEAAERELNRARRYNLHVSMLMLDLDHFKSVNDRYGHNVGDEVLTRFAEVCQQNLREIDVLGRIGGEEFAVLLPETNITQALIAAGRIREATEKTVLENGDLEITFTVSIGAAERANNEEDVDTLLKNADDALYQAKRKGRNRVETLIKLPV